MPELQISMNIIGQEYSAKIEQLQNRLDPYTLGIHSILSTTVKNGLPNYQCECKEIGRKKFKIFDLFYKLKCYNCSRQGQRDKYYQYEQSYKYLLEIVEHSEYLEKIQLYTGYKITKQIDKTRLVDLLSEEKRYVHALWSTVCNELKIDHQFNQNRTEIKEPQRYYNKIKKEKKIAKQDQFKLRYNAKLDSFLKKKQIQSPLSNASKQTALLKQTANIQSKQKLFGSEQKVKDDKVDKIRVVLSQ